MDSDSSCYTYYMYGADDESYEQRKERQAREHAAKQELRKQQFESYYEATKDNPDSFFKLPGINFISFTHLKMKFSFEPSKVPGVEAVNPSIKFYCSIRYVHNGFWLIKRNHIPVSCKRQVYGFFFKSNGKFKYTDDNVGNVIDWIHRILVDWSRQEHAFRMRKMQRYNEGEDVELDSDDEFLFLDYDEIEERRQRKQEIWERMLPPERTRRIRRRR